MVGIRIDYCSWGDRFYRFINPEYRPFTGGSHPKNGVVQQCVAWRVVAACYRYARHGAERVGGGSRT
ncbi:Uncharacterised protein [Vibrio cholerae]|uniref:Uncharacterized protein n=1 Tax=Vibrio cholerae TaxID=666 RepID=A0A655YT95_VIBCL|nr:Uncharacterised protein [Vibrio cholerae]